MTTVSTTVLVRAVQPTAIRRPSPQTTIAYH
jgi:hypothetical protein